VVFPLLIEKRKGSKTPGGGEQAARREEGGARSRIGRRTDTSRNDRVSRTGRWSRAHTGKNKICKTTKIGASHSRERRFLAFHILADRQLHLKGTGVCVTVGKERHTEAPNPEREDIDIFQRQGPARQRKRQITMEPEHHHFSKSMKKVGVSGRRERNQKGERSTLIRIKVAKKESSLLTRG